MYRGETCSDPGGSCNHLKNKDPGWMSRDNGGQWPRTSSQSVTAWPKGDAWPESANKCDHRWQLGSCLLHHHFSLNFIALPPFLHVLGVLVEDKRVVHNPANSGWMPGTRTSHRLTALVEVLGKHGMEKQSWFHVDTSGVWLSVTVRTAPGEPLVHHCGPPRVRDNVYLIKQISGICKDVERQRWGGGNNTVPSLLVWGLASSRWRH